MTGNKEEINEKRRLMTMKKRKSTHSSRDIHQTEPSAQDLGDESLAPTTVN
jgi:hypothetical protein